MTKELIAEREVNVLFAQSFGQFMEISLFIFIMGLVFLKWKIGQWANKHPEVKDAVKEGAKRKAMEVIKKYLK